MVSVSIRPIAGSILLAGCGLAHGLTLTPVVDKTMVAPGTSETFISVTSPAISGSNVAFIGATYTTTFVRGVYVASNIGVARVADTQMVMPGTTGNYSRFGDTDISGSTVVFTAQGSGTNEYGLFSFSGGSTSIVVNTSTPIPSSTGNFGEPYSPSISGTDIGFGHFGFGGFDQGVYRKSSGVLSSDADMDTPIPSGTGNFTSFGWYDFADGVAAFAGSGSNSQSGVYKATGGSVTRIADLTTPIPDGTGNFTGFQTSATSGGNVAFRGAGSDNQTGIYIHNGSALSAVADSSTPIPGGGGNFTILGSYLAMSGDNLLFWGNGASASQSGIYARINGQIVKVVTRGDTVNGRTVSDVEINKDSLDGTVAAVNLDFSDGHFGIYKVDLATASVSDWSVY